MSLVEVLVAMTILSVGVLGFVGSFSYISKAIRVSRARTLATNLAQEKVENLKNLSYYKLSLTTQVATNNNFSPPIYYDNLNYELEIINIGGITFRRAVFVTMAQVSNGIVTSVGMNYPDTGLKAITVYVMWQESSYWKSIMLDNVYENPVVDPLSGQITGVVRDGGGTGIGHATIRVTENSDWDDTADANGTYSIASQPGIYSLTASSAGYYDTLVTEIDLSLVSAVTQNFTLTEIASGTVTGRVWHNPNLLISHIMVSTKTVIGNLVKDTRVEFVQLFNPTTYPINIGSDAGGAETTLSYYYEHTPNVTYDEDDMLDDGAYTNYVSTYVPSLKYYLIASASWFWFGDKYTHADAHYNGTQIFINQAGSLQLTRVSDSYQWDAVGWSDLNPLTNYAAHAGKYEGNPIPNSSSSGGRPPQCAMDGIKDGWSALRFSEPGDVGDAYGPAYDSGDNAADFLTPSEACLIISTGISIAGLRNTTDSVANLVSGVPLFGANITADDLLGPATNAYSVTISSGIFGTTVTLTTEVAYFELAGVSTGTWSVVSASGAYLESYAEVIVTQGVSTGISNASTQPAETLEGWANLFLDTQTLGGYVSGVISDNGGNPLSGIEVLAGGETKLTGSNGRYFVATTSGAVYITANPNNINTAYVESIELVDVETGELETVDITLSEGGVIMGFSSSDGNSILPNVQYAATISGAQYGLAVADASGNFYIKNLSTGTYDVAPILDPLETYSPLSASIAVTPGVTVDIGTFTISGALGTLSGTIENNSESVTSGALVLISSDTIASTPPDIVASSSPAKSVIYAASSLADGTFEVEVRGSTSATYNVSVYVPIITGSGVTITTKSYSGISITAGNETTLAVTLP